MKKQKSNKQKSQPVNPNQARAQEVSDEQLQQVVGGHSVSPFPNGEPWRVTPKPNGPPWSVTPLPNGVPWGTRKEE